LDIKIQFGIINWRLEKIRKNDRESRKVLTMYKMHHPKADVDRIYMKRKEGGRGLLQIEATYKAEIINIAEYLKTKYTEDQFVNIVKNDESNQTNTNSKIEITAKIAEDLNKSNENSNTKWKTFNTKRQN
jgi:hypothetical protein